MITRTHDERDMAVASARAHDAPTLGSSRLVAAMLLLAIGAPACAALYIAAGSPVAMPPAVALALAMLIWLPRLRSGRAHRAGGRAPGFEVYIGTLVALMAQYTEQWMAHLPATLMRLFPAAYPPGVSYGEHAMIAAFPLAGTALFLFGALAFYYQHPVGEGAAWLLFTWALVSAASPFAYLAAGGGGAHYAGGMITAPIVAVCGIRGIQRLRAGSLAGSRPGDERP